MYVNWIMLVIVSLLKNVAYVYRIPIGFLIIMYIRTNLFAEPFGDIEY